MQSEQVLDLDIVKEFVLGEADNLKSLRSSHETALDPESLLSHLSSTSVGVLL